MEAVGEGRPVVALAPDEQPAGGLLLRVAIGGEVLVLTAIAYRTAQTIVHGLEAKHKAAWAVGYRAQGWYGGGISRTGGQYHGCRQGHAEPAPTAKTKIPDHCLPTHLRDRLAADTRTAVFCNAV